MALIPGNHRGAERDPGLDRLYGAAAPEEPPAHLDAALAAAARREVGARPRSLSARLRAWRVPVSIAAVLVLSVSLVTLMEEEGGEAGAPPVLRRAEPEPDAPRRPDAGRPTPRAVPAPPAADSAAREKAGKGPRHPASLSPPPDPASAGRAAERLPPQPSRDASGQAAEEKSTAVMADSVPAGPAVSAPGALQSESRRRAEAEAAGTSAERPGETHAAAADSVPDTRGLAGEGEIPPVGAAAQSREAPAPAPRKREGPGALSQESQPVAAEVAALLKEFELQPPSAWLRRIQDLKRQGRAEAAEGMLTEFKRRYPAHPLPRGLE
jgi:hypothetical protein